MKFFINFNLHLLSGTLSSNQSIHTLDLVLKFFMATICLNRDFEGY